MIKFHKNFFDWLIHLTCLGPAKGVSVSLQSHVTWWQMVVEKLSALSPCVVFFFFFSCFPLNALIIQIQQPWSTKSLPVFICCLLVVCIVIKLGKAGCVKLGGLNPNAVIHFHNKTTHTDTFYLIFLSVCFQHNLSRLSFTLRQFLELKGPASQVIQTFSAKYHLLPAGIYGSIINHWLFKSDSNGCSLDMGHDSWDNIQ